MDQQITYIGVIGAGALGHALGEALTAARLHVLYYDKDPAKSTTASIEDVIRACQVLFICVPSWAVKQVTHTIHKAAHPEHERLVVCMSKGVEPGFVTMDQALANHLPRFYDISLLYGPMIAEEIARGRAGHGVLALSNPKWFAPLRATLAEARIYVEPSTDLHGVALCAVLKNIYAIGFGMAEGLHLGINAKGRLAVKVMGEMKRLVADFHGDANTADGLAGLGDLVATGFSDYSFNYRVGKSLAEGIADEHIKSEGLIALDELSRAVKLKHYPLAAVLNEIVFHYGQPTKLADLLAA